MILTAIQTPAKRFSALLDWSDMSVETVLPAAVSSYS